MDNQLKKVSITGINNKYQVNKLIKENRGKQEERKRLVSEKWNFPEEFFEYNNQIKLIKNIFTNNYNSNDDISKIIIQQISQKISSYRSQDIIKKKLNNDKLITFESIINKMIECDLKCRYCKKEIIVLYNISREMTQWTVDRIDNDFGHNIDNFHLACLECNLNRRRRTDEKFLFTKQLNIIKQNNDNNNNDNND
jgi:hypothetical protein